MPTGFGRLWCFERSEKVGRVECRGYLCWSVSKFVSMGYTSSILFIILILLFDFILLVHYQTLNAFIQLFIEN